MQVFHKNRYLVNSDQFLIRISRCRLLPNHVLQTNSAAQIKHYAFHEKAPLECSQLSVDLLTSRIDTSNFVSDPICAAEIHHW